MLIPTEQHGRQSMFRDPYADATRAPDRGVSATCSRGSALDVIQRTEVKQRL